MTEILAGSNNSDEYELTEKEKVSIEKSLVLTRMVKKFLNGDKNIKIHSICYNEVILKNEQTQSFITFNINKANFSITENETIDFEED